MDRTSSKINSIKNRAYHSALLAGYDDPAVDEQIVRAWVSLTRGLQTAASARGEGLEPYTHSWLLQAHRKVMEAQRKGLLHIERGFYRSRVKKNIRRIGNKAVKCPSFTLVLSLVTDLLKRMPDMTPRDVFVEFERIHPFTDGNGRVGRLLYYFTEWYQNGKKTPKGAFTFTVDNQSEVDGWFEQDKEVQDAK